MFFLLSDFKIFVFEQEKQQILQQSFYRFTTFECKNTENRAKCLTLKICKLVVIKTYIIILFYVFIKYTIVSIFSYTSEPIYCTVTFNNNVFDMTFKI